MNLQQLLSDSLTPEEQIIRSKQFIDQLQIVRVERFEQVADQLELNQQKRQELYDYFFNGAKEFLIS